MSRRVSSRMAISLGSALFLVLVLPGLFDRLPSHLLAASPALGPAGDTLAPSSVSFPKDLLDRVQQDDQGSSPPSRGYVRVTDTSGKLSLSIPQEWQDINTGPWKVQNKEVGVAVAAGPRLDGFLAGASEPGVFIGVSHELAATYGETALLKMERRGNLGHCGYSGEQPFATRFYSGHYDYYMNCTGGTHHLLVATAVPANHNYIILVRMLVRTSADLAAAARILDTLQWNDDGSMHC